MPDSKITQRAKENEEKKKVSWAKPPSCRLTSSPTMAFIRKSAEEKGKKEREMEEKKEMVKRAIAEFRARKKAAEGTGIGHGQGGASGLGCGCGHGGGHMAM